MEFTTTYNMDAGGAAVTLGCTARADGTGERGASATTSHAFIGSSGSINYFGFSTGISGAATVNYMKSQYGGTCAILDGGGSTYLRYLGSTKQSSTRPIHNGLVVYYKQRSTPPTPPTPDPNPPIKPDGSYDTTKLSGAVIGKSYAFKNGTLKITQPFYSMINGSLVDRPLSVYTMKNNSLVPIIRKYKIDCTSQYVKPSTNYDYYPGEEFDLVTLQDTTYSGLPLYFWGWYTNKDLSSRVLGIHDGASGDRTYYAKWLQYKMQYKGNYITTGTVTKNLNGASGIPQNGYYYFSSSLAGAVSKATRVTSVYINVDYAGPVYYKPKIDYGYMTNPDSASSFVEIGNFTYGGPSETTFVSPKDCDFTIPAGSYFAVKCYRSGSWDRAYLYSESYYKYDGSETKTVDWQDSPNPPSGSWASGYPIKRYVQRYYNYDTSSFTSWTEV